MPVTNVEDTNNNGDNSQNPSKGHNGDNQTPFTAATQKADKHKKSKNKRKIETSPESLSSDSENSSSSEDSVEESNSTKSHRFQRISKSESHKWELLGEMPDYVKHQFECFIPEKDVEANLLILQPVHENVRDVKKLNDFSKHIMGKMEELEKIDPRSGNFICSKEVGDTILESSDANDYSKTGDNAQDKGIVNKSRNYGNAGQRSYKKSKA